MLTSFSDDEALFSAIMAGASGYLLKQVSGTDLIGAVRTAAAGGSLPPHWYWSGCAARRSRPTAPPSGVIATGMSRELPSKAMTPPPVCA